YMAPEQAGGRADHRADIFSVGAVFYEFLCGQPPFTAKDPFQLLEQIRIEEPRALHLVDATIPSELSDIVARAMRKDPAQRFPDLAQMRMPIAQAQRALADEVRRLGQQIRAQRDQLRRLQGAVADRLGSSNEDLAPPIAEPRHLAALQALERDLQARIEAARSLLSRADALAPSFERGTELLQAGRLTDAIAVFETISADMPEHAQVAEALARARAQADAERHRVLVHPSPDQQVLSAAGEAEDIADATVQRDAWRQSAGHSVVETAAWQLREVAPNGAARATGEKGRRWTFWAGWSLVALAGVAAIVIALAVSSSRSSRTAPGSPVTASSTPANPPAPTASSTPANPPAPTASSTPTNPPAPTASSTPANPPAPTASSTPATPPAPSGGSQSAPVSPSAGQVASVEQSVSKPAQSPRVEEREAARIPPDRPERPDEGGARNRPAEDQRDIEQTWAQLAGAKREADRAAAAFYAPKLLAMAQAKEKAAIEARQRSDHGAVTRLAAEAQSAYLAAARGAKREAEAERQTAPLRARVEQARAAVLARRQEALASDAERLAMDQIRAAETRHVEADALAARQSYAEAARAYDEAAARYTEAALRAKASTSK
ncbi:MAG TPA: hypothetical protein VMS64_37015, partial [Candidatus Methylomirabilis sp.]|nr:hypothetical protein [Candidatus Methylomirabilis sp.]